MNPNALVIIALERNAARLCQAETGRLVAAARPARRWLTFARPHVPVKAPAASCLTC